MLILRQSTAIDIRMGPFMNPTDAVTPVTGATIGAADQAEVLKADGAATAAMAGAFAAVAGADGWYDYTASAADTNTVGELVFVMQDASAYLPVYKNCYVVEEAVYDAMYGAAAAGPVLASTFSTMFAGITALAEWLGALAGKQAPDATAQTEIRATGAGSGTYDATTDSLEAVRDEFGQTIALSGTASAGSLTTITLTGGVATDNYYDGSLVIITGGTGVGQSRTILSYVGSTTVATVTRDWAVAPDGTSTFVVLGADVPAILEAGTAQAGAANSITLDANASAISDTYTNNFVMITAGTGRGQTRLIGPYNGTTKAATITPSWTTTPDATSVYQVLPMARVDVGGWLGTLVTGDGDWALMQSDLDDIQARLPAALVGGRMDSDVAVMQDGVIAAATFAAGAVDAAALAADAVNEIADAILPETNTALSNIPFVFVAASDHVTPVTLASGIVVNRSIDGGAFAVGTSTVAEVGNGSYQLDASAADLDGGIIQFRITATGGTPGAPDDKFITIVTRTGV